MLLSAAGTLCPLRQRSVRLQPFERCLDQPLLSEGKERLHSVDGTTLQPSIGTCIRRIKVASNPKWVTRLHNEDCIALKLSEEGIAKKSRRFLDSRLPSLIGIFARLEILPNLELLDWQDKIAIPRFFFGNLATSSVKRLKRLKLYRIMIDEDLRLRNPLRAGGPADSASGCTMERESLTITFHGFKGSKLGLGIFGPGILNHGF